MMLRHFRESLREPAFWAYATWLGIVTNYRRSRLGVLWLMTPPVIYVWGLGAFFASMQGKPLGEFAAHVAVGYLVFRLVTSVVTDSTGVLAANQAFILDGRVRITDFVLRVIARALFYAGVALPVVVVALWAYPDVQATGLMWLLVTLPLVLLNAVWISVVFSLVGARFPDTEQFIGNVFLFLFLLTPIIWYADQAPPESVRGVLMRFNPLFHLIEVVRAPLLGEPLNPSSLRVVAGMALAGWLAAALVYRRYARFVPLWI
jgi:ABC-type polysaccharide/polyol phosphate export permease